MLQAGLKGREVTVELDSSIVRKTRTGDIATVGREWKEIEKFEITEYGLAKSISILFPPENIDQKLNEAYVALWMIAWELGSKNGEAIKIRIRERGSEQTLQFSTGGFVDGIRRLSCKPLQLLDIGQ